MTFVWRFLFHLFLGLWQIRLTSDSEWFFYICPLGMIVSLTGSLNLIVVYRMGPLSIAVRMFFGIIQLLGPSRLKQSLGNGSWLSSSIILVSEIYVCVCEYIWASQAMQNEIPFKFSWFWRWSSNESTTSDPPISKVTSPLHQTANSSTVNLWCDNLPRAEEDLVRLRVRTLSMVPSCIKTESFCGDWCFSFFLPNDQENIMKFHEMFVLAVSVIFVSQKTKLISLSTHQYPAPFAPLFEILRLCLCLTPYSPS